MHPFAMFASAADRIAVRHDLFQRSSNHVEDENLIGG